MQGHVDGVGIVADVRDDGFARVVTIGVPTPTLLRYVVEKGSIASTASRSPSRGLDDDGFDVSLIPETLERTTLGDAEHGTARQPGGRRAGEVRREAGGAVSSRDVRSVRDDRGGDRGHPRRADGRRRATTRTARTRATSCMAAQFATPEAINFMAKQAARADLPRADAGALRRARPRPDGGQERVAARDARSRCRSRRARASRPASRRADRAHTIQVAIDPSTAPRDLVQPGHVFPLKAQGRRRARAHRPDRGGGRPRAPRRPQPGRRDLRDHERRRHDGPRRGPRAPTAASTASR